MSQMFETCELDIEDAFPQNRNMADAREFQEAALMLSLCSFLVANEGVVCCSQVGALSTPAFLGGLFEVIFGLFGLCVGLAAGFLRYHRRSLTLALIKTQPVVAGYVFIDYIFIDHIFLVPAVGISRTTEPMTPGLTLGASKLTGVMGILTSLAFCLALLGGQFVFTARLLAFSSPRDFFMQRTGAKMLAVFWNANLALGGLWVVVQACVVISGVGAGLTPVPVYLLITGVLMMVWPLLGIFFSLTERRGVVRQYAAMSFFVFLIVIIHYTMGQLGFLATRPNATRPAAGPSLHNGLIMMASFLGPYFMLKQAQEKTQ